MRKIWITLALFLAAVVGLRICAANAQQMGAGIVAHPSGWSILASACMEAAPGDCWSWISPKPFTTLQACQDVLARPLDYGYTNTYPLKVIGSKWVFMPACIGVQ